MQPVQLLQSGSVVIIGNDALRGSFHGKPFTATFHSRSHTQVTHCTLLRLIMPCILSSTFYSARRATPNIQTPAVHS
jgi:hypothetical protein